MATKDRENVLMQLGDYCINHTCKICPLKKLAVEQAKVRIDLSGEE